MASEVTCPDCGGDMFALTCPCWFEDEWLDESWFEDKWLDEKNAEPIKEVINDD